MEEIKVSEIQRYDVNEVWAHAGGPDGLQFQADAVAYCGNGG